MPLWEIDKPHKLPGSAVLWEHMESQLEVSAPGYCAVCVWMSHARASGSPQGRGRAGTWVKEPPLWCAQTELHPHPCIMEQKKTLPSSSSRWKKRTQTD